MKNVCFCTSVSTIHTIICVIIVDISCKLKCHRSQFCVIAIKNHRNKGKQMNLSFFNAKRIKIQGNLS